MEHWRKIKDRKWELKYKDSILATIFHKPTEQYSVYFSVPKVFQKLYSESFITYQFDSFEEAQKQCIKLYREKVSTWATDLLEYLTETEKESLD